VAADADVQVDDERELTRERLGLADVADVGAFGFTGAAYTGGFAIGEMRRTGHHFGTRAAEQFLQPGDHDLRPAK